MRGEVKARVAKRAETGAERSEDTLYESGHVRLTKDRTKP